MRWAFAVVVCALATSAHAATIYVVPDATKDGPGSDPKQPTGKLCAVIAAAKDGDTFHLAEGTYVLRQACLVSKRRISILGGYRADFSTRDPFMSIARWVNAGSPGTLLRADSGADDLLVEGVMFDGGQCTAYSATLCAECLASGYDRKAMPPLVLLDEAGRTRFRAVVFVNAPGGALSAALRSSLQLEAVSVVNARPFGVAVSGVCGYAAPRCADLLVRGSSFVWTWRETITDTTPGGSAVLIKSGVSARIEKTVIAYSDRAGVELETAENTELALQQMVMFDDRQGDVMIAGSGKAIGDLGEDSEVGGVEPRGRMERLALPWDIDYLNRFLGRAKERFYGARIAPNRVFMVSPAPDAGLKTPQGSRLSYEAAVAGNVQAAQTPPPGATDEEKDDPKKKKGKIGKKPGKKKR